MSWTKTVLPAGFGLLSAACLALAAASWGRTTPTDPADAPRLVYDPVRPIGTLLFDGETEVPVTLTNRTQQTVRVLGATRLCGHVCLTAEGLPAAIPPLSARSIRVHVAAGSIPGAFSQEIAFYTNSPGQAEVVLTFVGHLVARQVDAAQGGHAANRGDAFVVPAPSSNFRGTFR